MVRSKYIYFNNICIMHFHLEVNICIKNELFVNVSIYIFLGVVFDKTVRSGCDSIRARCGNAIRIKLTSQQKQAIK